MTNADATWIVLKLLWERWGKRSAPRPQISLSCAIGEDDLHFFLRMHRIGWLDDAELERALRKYLCE